MKFCAALFLVSALALASGFCAAVADETVVVTAPKDLDQAVHDFIHGYAKPTPLLGKMARWDRRTPLCPNVVGLAPTYNAFILARIRQVAGMVGAPLQTKLPCKANMVALFNPEPQAVLDAVRVQKPALLGYHQISQMEAMTRITHPIQAWYATATRDNNGTLRLDDAQAFDECVAIYGAINCAGASRGTRLLDGMHSEMAAVTVVANSNKIVGLQMQALADYIAMLALSQTQAFETCLPLPSIANLLTPGCNDKKAQSLTDYDMAYLKAVYKVDQDYRDTLQTSAVNLEMRDTLEEAGVGKKP